MSLRLLLPTAAATLLAVGCAGETSLTGDDAASALIDVSGAVHHGDEPVAGAWVCSLYTPGDGCVQTDADGAFALDVTRTDDGGGARSIVALTVDAAGFQPLLVPERIGVDADGALTVVSTIGMRTRGELGLSPAAQERGKGHVLVDLREPGGGVEWDARRSEGLVVFDAGESGGSTYYADDAGRLDPDLTRTTSGGVAVVANMEPGEGAVGITDRAGSVFCSLSHGFGAIDDQRVRVDVVAGRLTTLKGACYDLGAILPNDADEPGVDEVTS